MAPFEASRLVDESRRETGVLGESKGMQFMGRRARRAPPIATRRGGRTHRTALAFLLGCFAAAGARADLDVPAGGQYILDAGVTDLACTNVTVAGTLLVQSGSLINVRHLTIQPGGTIDGGSGIIELGGDWANSGTFTSGTGQVNFRDLCGLTSVVISGSTTFHDLSFVSSIGKNHSFVTGTTQTVAGELEIVGTAPNPLQFRTTSSGVTAFIDLVPGGTQAIQHVGVTDVWATGQWLAPLLTNEGGGGNANRWFGMPMVAPTRIPTLGDAALALAALMLALAGAMDLRRRVRPARERR